MKVQEVMTGKVTTCKPETNLATAAMLMWDNDCGVLPVLTDDGRVVGMVTDRDICIAAATKRRDIVDIPVYEVISGRLYACSPDDNVQEALKIMQQEKVRRLPVIDADGALQGLLSINDVALKAQESKDRKKPEISYNDVMTTFKAICAHPALQQVQQKTVGA
jgi:CBS domain-containing protein